MEISPLLDISRKNRTKNPTQILTKTVQAKPHQRKGEIHLLHPAMSFHSPKKGIDDIFRKMCHKKQAEGMLHQGK